MWLVIVIALSVGLGILALIGLLAVVKELISESVPGADLTESGGAAAPHDIAATHGRRREMTP
jgi:hypothetical protein